MKKIIILLMVCTLSLYGAWYDGHNTYAAPNTNFTVTVLYDGVDANPGDGVCADGLGNCTLRAAIQESNALTGMEEIYLLSGTYHLSLVGANEDLGLTEDLDITDSLIIHGAGQELTIIDVNELERAFHVVNSSLEINDLTIQNGFNLAHWGGAILADTSELQINRVTFFNNRGGNGGAFFLHGNTTTVVNDSKFIENEAVGWAGGAIFVNPASTLTLNDSRIQGNKANAPAECVNSFETI